MASRIDWQRLKNAIENTAKKHTPGILTGLGIAGMIMTAVLAAQATPKAVCLMAEENAVTTAEKVRACWKCYVPATVTGAVSIACLIAGNSVNGRRNAALATAYSLSETALKEYREKVTETFGDKSDQTIYDAIAKDEITKNPVSNREIIVTNSGDTLCLDKISGRYFKSDIDKIKRAQNEINYRMMSEMYISLNEFYDEINLAHIDVGDDIGWNVEKGLLEIIFSVEMADDEKTPCIVMNYAVVPEYNRP